MSAEGRPKVGPPRTTPKPTLALAAELLDAARTPTVDVRTTPLQRELQAFARLGHQARRRLSARERAIFAEIVRLSVGQRSWP